MSSVIDWLLIVAGALLILLEVLLGAVSGFDFLLIGSALLLGGVLGAVLHQPLVGFVAAGILSLLYVFVGRRHIRGRLRRPGIPSNIDALYGKTVVVVEEPTEHRAGRVRHEGEEWRALLDGSRTPATIPLSPGSKAQITRVDGVTVYVSPVPAGTSSGKESS